MGASHNTPTNKGKQLKYRIEYSTEVENHLRVLSRNQQVKVLNSVDMQLTHQLTVETRNRKPMRPNPIAPWELRIGNLRVYFDVQEGPEKIVYILAVGVKKRNEVRIGKEVIKL